MPDWHDVTILYLYRESNSEEYRVPLVTICQGLRNGLIGI